MVNRGEMIDYLNEYSRRNPSVIIGNLQRGSILQKSIGCSYEIDNVNADESLGTFPLGAIPYAAIYSALKSNQSEVMALFNDKSQVPFSRVLKAGVGQCLEKSILVQMAAQRGNNFSFLVNGVLEMEGELGADFHAFNLISRGSSLFLTDAENPLALDKDGKVARPYVVPVIELTSDGIVVVPKEYRVGRTYCLD